MTILLQKLKPLIRHPLLAVRAPLQPMARTFSNDAFAVHPAGERVVASGFAVPLQRAMPAVDASTPDSAPTMSDPAPLAPEHSEALLRVIESAPQVRRRYHFFIWTQGPMQLLLPHQLAICGAYDRHRKELVFEAFHSVAVPAAVLAVLTDTRSLVLQAAQAAWVANRGRPLRFDPLRLDSAPGFGDSESLRAAGYAELLVHGVSRPQRPSEVETFFVLASPQRVAAAQTLTYFDLMLPHWHNAYLRVQAIESELGAAPVPALAPARSLASTRTVITVREKQILRWVRDGKNNQQIGEVLHISPLTVKNHVQKILRKLGATTRAQAVAKAMGLHLLAGSAADGDSGPDASASASASPDSSPHASPGVSPDASPAASPGEAGELDAPLE